MTETELAPSDARSDAWLNARVAAVTVLSLTALVFPKLGLFAAVFTFLCFLSLPRRDPRQLRTQRWALTLAAVSSSVAFVRFVIVEAMPGIVQGGKAATGQRAISRLREILFAEDVMRQKALVDPDADRVGSAALLGELTAETGLRGARILSPPLLERYPQLVETKIGPAAEMGGYFFIVCLPKRGGGFTARPGTDIDEEQAERRFLAYAWPSAPGRGLMETYFLDEHERILVAKIGDPTTRTRTGVDSPPSCDDATSEPTRHAWQPWRDKKPRANLPGDGH